MYSILIINSAPFTNDFVKPITELYKNKKVDFSSVDYNEIPNNINKYSGIIISASPRGDDIIDAQLPFYLWLKNYNKPVLGSCHGHQLMAVLFGSKIIVGNESEEGMLPIEIFTKDHLLNGITSPHMVEQHHVKSVTLPHNFIQLAKSERCANQLMKHKDKSLYGCQFHIESQPDLLMNFAALCGLK